MLYVEKTIPDHCFDLAPRLKSLDRYEIAVLGLDPLHALLLPFRYNRPNIHTFTILTEHTKEVVAIFGVIPTKTNPRVGYIWFLASDLLDKYYRYFLRGNKRWLGYMEEHFDYLCNWIIEEHTVSIRWLKWQGFNFSHATLVKDVKMLYFYKRIHKVFKKGTLPLLKEIGPIWTTKINQER
jgi:hypothetical protein|tara:strand:+ start:8224 stop:8766 length:543 start_codon:yes stop_codon:yes gene_type:complete